MGSLFDGLEIHRRIAGDSDQMRRMVDALSTPNTAFDRAKLDFLLPKSLVDELGRSTKMWEESLRPLLETYDSAQKMADILGSADVFTRISEDASRLREILTGENFDHLFRLPRPEDREWMQNIWADLARGIPLASYQPAFDTIAKAITGISTPWISEQNAIVSLQGLSEIMTLGKALADAEPFGAAFTKDLREQLGDWRKTFDLPEFAIYDPVARINFYEGLGFNSILTCFPPKAFRETLGVAGFVSQDSPLAPPEISWISQEVHREEDHLDGAMPVENVESYEQIYRFETKLRQFIDEEMTKAWGSNWIKQKVSEEIRKSWKEKREFALANGEREQRLLWYANFSDYKEIIIRKDNWGNVFQLIFGRKEFVLESFHRLNAARVTTMYNRELTGEDVLFLVVEIKRLSKAMWDEEWE